MGRFISIWALTLIVVFASFVSSLEARKLLTPNNIDHQNIDKPAEVASSSSIASLFLSVLPKGEVPSSSTPSNKGHADVIDEKLVARHLISINRILRSVPSPGVGH